MSSNNTVINWGTRYRVNGTFFNATGGEIVYNRETAIVTDSEDAGARHRKPGEYEAEITIRGNIATDLNPHATPFLFAEGSTITIIEVFVHGINNAPETLNYVLIDRFRKVPGGGGDMNQPNVFELHGFTWSYSRGGA